MYELLIVDDEIHIANGIKASMIWDQFNISTVHIANSTKQAMDIFRKCSIDIMICDIEMPEGDGFELLRWVREEYPSTQAVFLTCHAEFSYAQKAIQLGSLDYILKPVPREVLEGVISKAIDKIVSDRKNTELSSAHQPVLIERFWLDLLNHRISSKMEHIMERIEAIHIPIKATTLFLPIVISVQRWLKELTVREEQIMEYALSKAAEESFFINGRQGHAISTRRGLLLVVLFADSERDMGSIKEICKSYINACNQYLYCHLSCFIGKQVYVHEMKEIYDQLLHLDKENVTCHNQVFVYGENRVKEKSTIFVPQQHLSLWYELLKHGDKGQLLHEVLTYIDSWKGDPGVDHKCLQQFYQDFLQTIHHFMKQKGISGYTLLLEVISPERSLVATRSVIDLQEWVREIVEEVTNYLKTIETNQTVSDKIKTFVTQNIDKDFSRQDIADHLELSPTYMMRLFKKETGMSISDFIVNERVKKAKSLLSNTNISISDISLLVGYSNFSYFSKVFKNATNLNPQEFRRIHRA